MTFFKFPHKFPPVFFEHCFWMKAEFFISGINLSQVFCKEAVLKYFSKLEVNICMRDLYTKVWSRRFFSVNFEIILRTFFRMFLEYLIHSPLSPTLKKCQVFSTTLQVIKHILSVDWHCTLKSLKLSSLTHFRPMFPFYTP